MTPGDMEVTRTSSPKAASDCDEDFEHLVEELELSSDEQEEHGDVSRPPSCFVSMCQVGREVACNVQCCHPVLYTEHCSVYRVF